MGYLGCGTKRNKLLWTTFALLLLVGAIFIGVGMARLPVCRRNLPAQCNGPTNLSRTRQAQLNPECRQAFVNCWRPFLIMCGIGVLALVAALVTTCIMCCCGKTPQGAAERLQSNGVQLVGPTVNNPYHQMYEQQAQQLHPQPQQHSQVHPQLQQHPYGPSYSYPSHQQMPQHAYHPTTQTPVVPQQPPQQPLQQTFQAPPGYPYPQPQQPPQQQPLPTMQQQAMTAMQQQQPPLPQQQSTLLQQQQQQQQQQAYQQAFAGTHGTPFAAQAQAGGPSPYSQPGLQQTFSTQTASYAGHAGSNVPVQQI